jgi:hypothetical protein
MIQHMSATSWRSTWCPSIVMCRMSSSVGHRLIRDPSLERLSDEGAAQSRVIVIHFTVADPLGPYWSVANCSTKAEWSAGAGTLAYPRRMRDIETIDSELRLVAALRRAARSGWAAAVD